MSRTPSLHFVSRAGLTLLLALFVTVVNCSLPARSPAALMPTVVKSTEIQFTDPADDVDSRGLSYATGDGYEPELDLLAGDIVQDRANSIVRATIQLRAPTTGFPALLRVALGYTKASGRCTVLDYGSNEVDIDGYPVGTVPVYIKDGTLHLKTRLDDSLIDNVPALYRIGSSTPIKGPVTRTPAGDTVSLTTEASSYFSARGWDCALVSVEVLDSVGRTVVVDEAEAFAPDEAPTPTVPAAPTPIGNATAVAYDTDFDGIPDVSDSCPKVAGAGINGCPSVPDARSVVLGTKRVVFDRLLPLAAAKCPAAVKATAVLGGKTVGKGLIGVLPHGKFCQVKGVLKLKKKIAKARVTVAGSGVAKFAITIKR